MSNPTAIALVAGPKLKPFEIEISALELVTLSPSIIVSFSVIIVFRINIVNQLIVVRGSVIKIRNQLLTAYMQLNFFDI